MVYENNIDSRVYNILYKLCTYMHIQYILYIIYSAHTRQHTRKDTHTRTHSCTRTRKHIFTQLFTPYMLRKINRVHTLTYIC